MKPEIRSWFDRAMDRTEIRDGCWIYTGDTNYGYGQLKIDGKNHRLSRYAYGQLVEPIKAGNFVCHKCDNRACWNPDHLFQGTHKENMRDMVVKGRSSKRYGEAQHSSKLTNDDVSRIKSLLREGVPQRTIAKEFNVTQSCIWAVRAGLRWQHVQ